MTARGVFSGAAMPNQTTDSAPLIPDSESVGTSGSSGDRFALATPITRTRFDLICASALTVVVCMPVT